MKKLIKLMAAFMFLFTFTFVSQFQEVDAAKYPGTSVTAKPGDILVTKKSSCKTNCRGITGHAGIVVNNDYVVHIAGTKKGMQVLETRTMGSFLKCKK